MKEFILILSTILFSATLFAHTETQNLAKTSRLNELSSAWKNAHTLKAKQDENDIAMVYGGKDISLRPSLTKQTTFV